MNKTSPLIDFISGTAENIGYFITTSDFDIVAVNPFALSILDLESVNIIDKNLAIVLNGITQDNPIKSFTAVRENVNKLIGYTCACYSDKEKTLVWDIEKKYFDHDMLYLLSVYTPENSLDDLALPTSYINEQNKLHFSEKILNELPGFVYWKNKESVYMGCNQNLATLVGYNSPSEIIGKTDFDLSWKETAPELRKNDLVTMKMGKPHQAEETGKLGDGTMITYITNKVPLYDKDTDKIIGILGASLDISPQKQTEKSLTIAKNLALEQSEIKIEMLAEIYTDITGQTAPANINWPDHIQNIRDYFEHIISKMPGLVFWKDNNGIYRGCNDVLVELHGLKSRKDLIGKSDYSLFSKEEARQLIENDNKVKKSRIKTTFEEAVHFHNNESTVFMTHKVPLFDENQEPNGILGISLDITQRKKTEIALKKAKDTAEKAKALLEIFAGAIAHELRTPLTSIGNNVRGIERYLTKLYTGYLQAKKNNLSVPFISKHHMALLPEITQNIMKEVNFSQSIININLAQVGLNNSDKVKLEQCSIQGIIAAALERYPYKDNNEKDLIKNIPDYNFYFMGSPLLMVHVLLNLLKNSLYFIESADKGDVTISCHRSGGYNELHFTDTGPGVAKEQQQKIFEHFYSKRQHGTGIGLAFCKQVIESFNGTIVCESELNKFTRFTISLPSIDTLKPNN